MSVKKAAGTTFWLIFLFVGIALLLPIIRQALPYEVVYSFDARFYSQYYVGGFFPFVVNLAVWIIVIAGTLDAILNNKFHFQLLGSFSVVIVLSIPTIIAGVIPAVTPYMFWGIYQLIAILGTYWAFRKFSHNKHYGGQKMIPFIKELKNAGGLAKGHISDHYIAVGMGSILAALEALQIISFIIFAIMYWNTLI